LLLSFIRKLKNGNTIKPPNKNEHKIAGLGMI